MAYIDEDSTQIKLISELYFKPKYKLEAAQKPYFLGPIELWFLQFDQMQRGLLFGSKPKDMQSFISNLSESLSISLVDFYPLAGQICIEKFPNEDDCWVYVDCDKGPGARIIHAIAVSVAVKDILSSKDVHTSVRSMFDFGVEAVNYDGHHRPLLSIQVTELIDGVFIGFTINHSLADGTSSWHFISTISEIYAQLMEKQGDGDNNIVISRKPIFVPNFPDGCCPVLKLC
ncbi:putative acetyltransferase At3g50280 [Silene latifolia]|uniref:putative acetyltransferase At3g50280 n=1 Tax=Silene latifolia TaxID=37657 RepID=UPI003D78514E